jgi:hypothetical protein
VLRSRLRWTSYGMDRLNVFASVEDDMGRLLLKVSGLEEYIGASDVARSP